MSFPIATGADFGDVGHSVLLYEGYKEHLAEATESGASTDFPTYLSNIINKNFMDRYSRWASEWTSFVKPFSVKDFRSVSWVSLAGFPDLLQVREGGEYKDAAVNEVPGPSIQVKKFGRTFSMTYETIVNDDLGKLAEVPNMMAEAAAVTLAVDVVQNTLENPGTAYDSVAFFHATHNNLGSAALDEAALATAVTTMRIQTDVDGRRIGLRPKYLVVPPQLEFTARRIISDAPIYNPPSGQPAFNPVKGIVEIIVEPYLTDVNDWYLMGDPNVGRAAMVVAYLNGMTSPSVYLKDESIRLRMGGMNHNPYTFQYDEIWYKVRHFWAAKMWEWRSAYKSAVA